jgi:hypothetical protein
MLRESFTAVLAQGEIWSGQAATEPYEAGWAGEAMFFLRLLEGSGEGAVAAVQVSPDGMHWADEGTRMGFPAGPDEVAFCRVRHFGQYLRLAASLPGGASCKVLVTLSVKT